jgi:hypothetical protein
MIAEKFHDHPFRLGMKWTYEQLDLAYRWIVETAPKMKPKREGKSLNEWLGDNL